MAHDQKEIRTTDSMGGLTLPERGKRVIEGAEEVGVDWDNGEITISPDPQFGRDTRSNHDGKVIIPAACRTKYGEGRYYRIEADDDEGIVRVYPQVLRDARATMVEDGF